MDKYIRKNATFNTKSKHHMEIWEWCRNETEDFQAQNFADFVREKLDWCMKHEEKINRSMGQDDSQKSGWGSLI